MVGYFVTHVPNVLGIDIDDHGGKAWAGSEASPLLLSLYGQVCQKLRCRPSILFQSPRGLHGYWILTERLPVDILHDQTRARLGNLKVEVRPTPTTSLRIPAERRILDPELMQPIFGIPFEAWLDAAPQYHPAVLFDSDVLPAQVRDDLVRKRQKIRVLRNIPQIEKVEVELLPLRNGDTNETFLRLCLAYRMAGLDEDGAIYRFAMCLMRSPGYSGGLRNPKELQRRVRFEFRKNTKNYVPKQEDVQLDFVHRLQAEDLAQRHPFAKQRTKPIIRFVERVLYWADWHDEILKNSRQTAFFDYLYPYYRKNRREGYYPLPKSFLRKANDAYSTLMPWLIERRFFQPAPYKYAPKAGICRYYAIQGREKSHHIFNNISSASSPGKSVAAVVPGCGGVWGVQRGKGGLKSGG